VLCAHLFHSLTPYALDRSPAEAVAWFRDMLAEAVGHPVPEPAATVVTSWAHDPSAAARTRTARRAPTRRCWTCSVGP
jgi:hypothetical protein